ncbi:MAG TPA: hypothetical protein DEQ87_05365 [Algoriphagus sp.]|nr:hypothetical protein [Algoriphagus sp.]MAN87091.1 hypothetical protein [Algoriphagus sp.]HAD51823.1 hypothetical protein [Algoriphagus sp.]HAH35156.1 hypothetical protein [Algoriphagus sp.]HAS57605.1 hypothetical protein [Algoriphagus sp.]
MSCICKLFELNPSISRLFHPTQEGVFLLYFHFISPYLGKPICIQTVFHPTKEGIFPLYFILTCQDLFLSYFNHISKVISRTFAA